MSRKPSDYFGDQETRTKGRTRLLGEGGQPIPPAEGVEAASGHDGRSGEASGGATPPAPATRQLRDKQRNPTGIPPRDYPNGCEWVKDGNTYRHLDCGGEVVGVGKARPFCRECRQEWWLDNRAGKWVRF